jgi:hypothetical protein
MTLRMNPLLFQFAVSGCATFAVLAHRTMIEWLPMPTGAKLVSHLRAL